MSHPRDFKSRGEWVELIFMQEARRRGLMVAKPFGDTAPYDVLVGSAATIYRVQVKGTTSRHRGSYHVVAASGSQTKTPYTKCHIDFLAAYLIPENLWYIVPVEAFSPRLSLWLCSEDNPHSPYCSYRSAWRLLAS